MFIYEQLAVGQVSIELGDVGLSVGNVRCTSEMVGMIEENILNIGRIRGDIAIPRLSIIGIFGLLPLDWRSRRRAQCGIAFGVLHPTVRHRVVA